MNEEEFNKKLKGTKIFSIFVSCIFSLLLIFCLTQRNYIYALICLIFIVCFILFFALTKKKLIAGPILGIVLGSIYIASFLWVKNIVSVVLGIVVILDSVSMLKYLRNK